MAKNRMSYEEMENLLNGKSPSLEEVNEDFEECNSDYHPRYSNRRRGQ